MAMIRYAMDIDWQLLTQQKLHLLELIDADCRAPDGLTAFGSYSRGDHPLDGLVAILDSIQDQAEALGEQLYPNEEDE